MITKLPQEDDSPQSSLLRDGILALLELREEKQRLIEARTQIRREREIQERELRQHYAALEDNLRAEYEKLRKYLQSTFVSRQIELSQERKELNKDLTEMHEWKERNKEILNKTPEELREDYRSDGRLVGTCRNCGLCIVKHPSNHWWHHIGYDGKLEYGLCHTALSTYLDDTPERKRASVIYSYCRARPGPFDEDKMDIQDKTGRKIPRVTT